MPRGGPGKDLDSADNGSGPGDIKVMDQRPQGGYKEARQTRGQENEAVGKQSRGRGWSEEDELEQAACR